MNLGMMALGEAILDRFFDFSFFLKLQIKGHKVPVLINKQEYVLTLKNPGQSNPPPFSLRSSGTPAPPSAFATSIPSAPILLPVPAMPTTKKSTGQTWALWAGFRSRTGGLAWPNGPKDKHYGPDFNCLAGVSVPPGPATEL
jgi:hypothetical protein